MDPSPGGRPPSHPLGGAQGAHRPAKVQHNVHRYRIERVIGTGQTGVVYEARWLLPRGHSMPVACKLGCDDFRDLPSYRDYIRRVAELGLRLTHNHGNLVTVLNQFEEATRGWPCLVLELIDGCSLADLQASHRRLPFSVIRRMVIDILSALAYLHGKQVLLIDLSPFNILVSTAGEVKVTALNIVEIEEERQERLRALGAKVVYANPAVLRAAMIDARSDLYSVGAMLYDLLTGHRITRLAGEVRLPADIPDDLATLTLGWLHNDPEARRPHRADEALEMLRRSGEPIASRAELGALAIVAQHGQHGQHGERAQQARDAPSVHTSEILTPGHVLVQRFTVVWKPAALEADRALGAVRPARRTKRVRRARSSGAWRPALILVLMAACVALGALLRGRLLAGDEPPQPATTAAPR